MTIAHACLAPFVFASHSLGDRHLLMPLFLCRRWEGISRAPWSMRRWPGCGRTRWTAIRCRRRTRPWWRGCGTCCDGRSSLRRRRLGPSAIWPASASTTAASCAAAFPAPTCGEATFKNCGFADAEGQRGREFRLCQAGRGDVRGVQPRPTPGSRARTSTPPVSPIAACSARGSAERGSTGPSGARWCGPSCRSWTATWSWPTSPAPGFRPASCATAVCARPIFPGADLTGANLTGSDLFQAIIDGAKAAGADLRGAALSGFDLRRLADWTDLKINADQQFALLDALGVDVVAEKKG